MSERWRTDGDILYYGDGADEWVRGSSEWVALLAELHNAALDAAEQRRRRQQQEAARILGLCQERAEQAEADAAVLREQLAFAGAVVAATERYLELISDCDFVGGEPGVCPGVAENGGPCHWCDMRQAVAAYRASAAPAESERRGGPSDE